MRVKNELETTRVIVTKILLERERNIVPVSGVVVVKDRVCFSQGDTLEKRCFLLARSCVRSFVRATKMTSRKDLFYIEFPVFETSAAGPRENCESSRIQRTFGSIEIVREISRTRNVVESCQMT